MIKLKNLLLELRPSWGHKPEGWTDDHKAALDLLNKEFGGNEVLKMIRLRRNKGESLADAIKGLAKDKLDLEL